MPVFKPGNKICQYLTLWVLSETITGVQARILSPMYEKLRRHFEDRRQVSLLSDRCSAAISWQKVSMGDEKTFGARLAAGESLHVTGGPCPVSRFYARREEALAQLVWRANVSREAERRLARAPNGTRTYIGVHVRRTDYAEWLRDKIHGHLVSPAYLRCALRHARRTYPRPAFLVSSDDMAWCRTHIVGDDVMFVGSDASEAFDMATLGMCNHTIVTYGTFGYMSAFLAGGDVIVPTGYSKVEYSLVGHLRQARLNVTQLKDSDEC
ncbi:galactoside alpha-(1,2)-fucosyltransferase 2-like [Pollicipes pollicipes]|uniref:galactoside alpha-(1,2)-fucosyltransferase 2-like n=1 Tax=Pollicipes pollicipes TaxID=41117 RepID=UPI00188529C9|nr:galactoside alpha-(1,2)-fucosyltransferase 2-like [Pollicipes pollicipes]